jgi:CubicO group peptidase (beta-lactamase class C family)
MDRNHIPSIAALRVADGGATTETAFWGYANIENKEKPTPETAYLLASVSKLFVATAIMQLEERGMLGLGDDVNKLLPESFPSIRNPSFPNVPITVRYLLTHTASIRDDWDVIDESYVFDGVDPEISLQAFTKAYFTPSKSRAYRAKHKPGTDYAYANMGAHRVMLLAQPCTLTLTRIPRSLAGQDTSFSASSWKKSVASPLNSSRRPASSNHWA